jgi:peptidoglycan-associated lipoprotein
VKNVVLISALFMLTLAGCARDSYVVLMANDDGTVGKISYRDKQNNDVIVDKPGHGVLLDSARNGSFVVNPKKIETDFRDANSARPQLPVSYMLYFRTDRVELTDESKAMLPKILNEVAARPAPDVSIIGHTDTVSTTEYNEELGLQRAQLIATLIKNAGLKVSDLTVTSHGKRNLFVDTPDNTPEPRNRRVEITVR